MRHLLVLLTIVLSGCLGPLPYEIGDKVYISGEKCPGLIVGRLGPKHDIGMYRVEYYCGPDKVIAAVGLYSGNYIRGITSDSDCDCITNSAPSQQ